VTLLEVLSWFSVMATAALSAMVLVRRPPAPLWPSLFFVAWLAFVWCLGEVMDTIVVVDDLAAYRRWVVVEYTGVLFLPPAWWYFGGRFAEMHGVRAPRSLAVLRFGPLVLAVGFWVAMVTNPWHGHFFTPRMGERNDFHAIWYVQASFNYLLMTSVIVLFMWLRRRAQERAVREQLTIMLGASITPLLLNFLWISGVVEAAGAGLTSAGLGISMVLFFAGIYRDRLFALSSISMHHLIEHETDGMLVMDVHGRLLHSNPAADRLLDGEVLTPNIDVFDLLSRLLRAGEGGTPLSTEAIERAVMPEGGDRAVYRLEGDETRWLEIHVVPIPDRSGRRLGTGLRLCDVTALREAREQLQEQAAVLEAILGSAEQGMLVVDSKGAMVYANRAFLELWSPGEPEPPPADDGDLLAAVASQLADPASFLAELTSPDEGAAGSTRREMVLEDGRIIERSSHPLLESDGVSGRVWSFFDVTAERLAERERQQLERQMLQAQKMESLGILAGGIAHDFNNLLVGIMGNADVALGGVPRDSGLRGPLEDIVASSRRAAELTNQMLAYSGRSRFVMEPIDLPSLTTETRHLIEAVISKTARIELDLADVPPVEGDSAQLRQVIMNLITNASDALMGVAGSVRIATRLVHVGHDVLSGYQLGDSAEPGPYVCLEVSDTGAGMDEAIAARIFDPFFTTKFTGRGLGLSAVLGIVRAHRGAIQVDSALGRGTTIRLLLPTTTRPIEVSEDRRGEAADEHWRASGTIIVADDEPHVLRVLKRTLERAGFEVVTAANGREALERFDELADEVVAVILDMTMPVLGGRETLTALRESGACVPVILTSGYSAYDAEARLEGDRPDAFIQKPYETRDLLATLRGVIEPEPEA